MAPLWGCTGFSTWGSGAGGSFSSQGCTSIFTHFVRLSWGAPRPPVPPRYPAHHGPTAMGQLDGGRIGPFSPGLLRAAAPRVSAQRTRGARCGLCP